VPVAGWGGVAEEVALGHVDCGAGNEGLSAGRPALKRRRKPA